MESISHSLPKKSYRGGNGGAGKTVYDDVFASRPKLKVATISPRDEDYSEIFEVFHASRGSTIPVLDLPAVEADEEDSELFFDVRSSSFDYSEVFGSSNGSDFAVSYEQLFKQSKADDDSSDEAWTPAQSGSLSDESDPSGCSEKNQSLSSGDLPHSDDVTKQFNISYHKVNPKGKDDLLNGMTHVTQLDAIPGYSFIINETSPLEHVDDGSSHLQSERNTDFGRVVIEGKRLRKTMSQPPISDFGFQGHKIEPNLLAHNDKSISPGKAFISVSDVSLRTRPSHLPPPSRPPPSFADRAENSSRQNSKLKASKSYVFERIEAEYSPPYFDVEIDASSSAAASAAAMKNAVEKAQAQLSNAKEMMDRKKEGLEYRTKSHLERDVGHKGEKIIEFDKFKSSKGDRFPPKYEREDSEMKAYAGENRKKVRNTIHVDSSATDRKDDIRTEQREEHTQSQVPHKTEGTVAWREAAQFYEVVEEKKVREAYTSADQSTTLDYGVDDTGFAAAIEQQECHMQTKAATVDHECQEIREKFEVLKGGCEQVEIIAAQGGSVRQEDHQEKSKWAQMGGEWQEGKKTRVTSQPGETDNKPNEVGKFENDDILTEDQLKENEVIFKKEVDERVEHLIRIKETPEGIGSGMERKEYFDSKEYEIEFRADVKQEKDGGKLKEILGQSAKDNLEKEDCERQVSESKHVKTCEMGQNKEKRDEVAKREEKTMRSKEVFEHEESNNRFRMDLKQQESKKEQKSCEAENNEKGSKMTIEQGKNTERKKRSSEKEASEERSNDDIEPDEKEKRLKEAWEKKEKWKRLREARESDKSEKRVEILFKEDDIMNRSSEANVWIDCKNNNKEERNGEGLNGQDSAQEQLKRAVSDKKLNLNRGNYTITEEQKTSDGLNLSGEANTRATRVTGHDKIHGNQQSHEPSVCEENESLRMEHKTHEREVEVKNVPQEARFNLSDMDQNGLQHEGNNNENKDESHCQIGIADMSNENDIDLIGVHVKKSNGTSEIASDSENANILTHTWREGRKNFKGIQYAFNQEENKDKFTESQVVQESVENERKSGDVLPAQKLTSQSPEVEETNFRKKIILEEKEKEERLKRESDLENEFLRKIEEEKEREREREKDRMAVDTATREACERAFADSRGRAERAAVERATAEVRQRALAEARERLEKASAEARERLISDKASDARLKAERTAVERATAEARERAIEKAKAEKASNEARERVERPVTDKFSAYSRNGGFRQSYSSNDLQNLQHQSMGPSRDLKYSHSSVSGGLEGESAQRCKARLERYQRTAERAAKALAEKNMRDLIAHKEQTERNRLAESLDADVKRWSSGKEGNLRALLSTLQYILGPNSGWQPVPLTDVITAAAVKKAYRKATLCVHPDKLQQRGASIHQKYICEKVFDLLKEAWNKFNSEER